MARDFLQAVDFLPPKGEVSRLFAVDVLLPVQDNYSPVAQGGEMMSVEQTLQEGEGAFVQHLKEYARVQVSPIDETVWHHPVDSNTSELTVVSNRKAYIISLPCQDLTDPHRDTVRQDILRMLLQAIGPNSPVVRGRREE
jgi:hypothetical protein